MPLESSSRTIGPPLTLRRSNAILGSTRNSPRPRRGRSAEEREKLSSSCCAVLGSSWVVAVGDSDGPWGWSSWLNRSLSSRLPGSWAVLESGSAVPRCWAYPLCGAYSTQNPVSRPQARYNKWFLRRGTCLLRILLSALLINPSTMSPSLSKLSVAFATACVVTTLL